MAGSNRKLVLLVSAALYVAACLLPAVNPDGKDPVGLALLMIGALGPTVGEYRWFANCFYVAGIALALRERPRRPASIICLLVGAAIAISCIPFPPHVMVGLGNYSLVQAPLAIGGYLWILAQIVALALPFMSPPPHERPRGAEGIA
jgi:hypothetical protein